jgi:hypothetical protein
VSQQWKKDELDVCRMCGSERTGPVGRMGPDCTKAAPWAIQVKRGPRPSLRAAWLEQAQRDQDHRPWLLVQAWYRPGRARVFLATCEYGTLAACSNQADYGVTVRRHAHRPRLTVSELEALLRAEGQPWLLIQEGPQGIALATLDYRALCAFGRRAGVIPNSPEPSRKEPQP